MAIRNFTPVIVILMLYLPAASGQFYTTGDEPASVQWNKIHTPHFTLVFSRDNYATANHMANLLEHNLAGTSENILYRAGNLPVLLHSNSVLSNGYVTWAPRRMEVVTTPPQDAYAQDWTAQLALHEYRHAVQIGSLNKGFTRAMTFLTGEISTGVVSSMIPSWFYEGDAVVNETRLSGAGRGRVAGFEMPLRTLLLQRNKVYSFDKAVFGSYRDQVPSAYQYGYQIVSYAGARYGRDLWTSALDYTARNPFLIWPLALHLKKQYGMYKSSLYQLTMDSLKHMYNNDKSAVNYINYLPLNKEQRSGFTQYTLPKNLDNGDIMVLKSGLDYPDRFVLMDSSGNEKVILTTGYFPGFRLDVHHNRVVWDEIVTDPRWERRDYSEIRVLDLQTGKPRALTRRTRYFSPTFSPGGQLLVVAETDQANNHFITLLDAFSGDAVQRIPSPFNHAVQQPVWAGDSAVVAITVSDRGKQLELINIYDHSSKILLPATRFDLAEPAPFGNFILFRSAYNGVENIYAVSRTSGDVFQVTFSRFGAWHPDVSSDRSRLLFSEYSAAGFNLVSAHLDPKKWKKISLPTEPSGIWPGTHSGGNIYSGNPAWVHDSSYVALPYGKMGHLFRIHSWLPFYTSLTDLTGSTDELPVNAGIMLFSQNLLSNFISSVGYRYADGYHTVIPTFTWSGWYPVIEFTGEYGGPLTLAGQVPEGVSIPAGSGPQSGFTIRAYVPLLWDRGKYYARLVPRVEYEWANDRYYGVDRFFTGIDYLHWQLSAYRYLRMAHRDLYPRWGQALSVDYSQTPSDRRILGSIFSMEAILYFPGLFPHHHLYVSGGYQHQQLEKYFVPINRIDFPRGFDSEVSEDFISLDVNYAFPVICPDWSIAPVLYLKRIRMNLYHDWSYGNSVIERTSFGTTLFTGNYRSFGTEIVADLHLIRFIFPISAGVRLGYKPGRKEGFAALMLNIHTGVF